MDENIVYFMLDIMITNNSIPTNSEIPTPFHAKKEQWLSHFKRVAYVGDHTLYTCEYMWWCERWVCVRYFSEPCSSFSSFTWLSLVLLIFFFKQNYLFIYLWTFGESWDCLKLNDGIWKRQAKYNILFLLSCAMSYLRYLLAIATLQNFNNN